MRAIRIHPSDDVAVAVSPVSKGETALGVTALEDIPAGHKMALRDIATGEPVKKYGMPIGRATQDIVKGETNHFDSWPLVAAAWLDVFTLRGAVLGVQHATGLCAEDVEALIRRHLGPERTAP